MGVRNLLLVTTDLQTVNAVKSALQSNGQLKENAVCGDLTELAIRLQSVDSQAVLVDIDENPQLMLGALETLVHRHSGTRFIVLSGQVRNDLLLEAMQVGARHFMLKEAVASDLTAVLRRVCPESNGTLGMAITVLSAGGGSGATTVAVNLAAELQLTGGEKNTYPALVVDLDPCYGAVGSYLGMDGEYGVIDLLGRSGPIDSQLIISTAQAHTERMHALLSKSSQHLGEEAPLDPQRLALAAEACRRAYHWSVFDAPRISIAAAAELSKQSAATLLLLQLTVKDLRIARRMLDGMAQLGVARENVTVVINRYRKRGNMISIEDAVTALKLSDPNAIKTLANDYYAITEAINFGKPLNQTGPRSDFRRNLQNLVNAIVAKQPRQTASAGIAALV